MRASIRDIIVAIAFGNIVYRLIAQGDDTNPYGYREEAHVGLLQRLYRLKGLLDMSHFLLNIAKRSLLRLMLGGVGLASKNAV